MSVKTYINKYDYTYIFECSRSLLNSEGLVILSNAKLYDYLPCRSYKIESLENL